MKRIRHYSSPCLVLALAGSLSFLLAGCSNEQKTSAQAPPPSVPVVIATVIQKDVPIALNAIGNVEAFQTVAIKSQLNGELLEVHFKEGQDVERGDLLFTLDQRQLNADLARIESNLVRDQAQAKNARIQAERNALLLKEGVIAQQQLDQVISNADAFDATVAADKAAVEYARLQLQYTKIYSPVSGRTGNVIVDRGNIVKANDTIALVNINQISPIYVAFSIPEQQLSEVKRYLATGTLRVQAMVKGENQLSPSAIGQLTFIDNIVDSATGTIKLKGTFANADRHLWPGQFVDVTLTLSTESNAIVVPSQAVQTGQKGQYVFVVNSDMSVDLRSVTVKRSVGNDTVITSGLQPGERVVTDGQLKLTKGAKVEMKTSTSNPEPASQSATAGTSPGGKKGSGEGSR